MIVFETIFIMLASAVQLLATARRPRLLYPVLLALAGAAVAVARVPVDIARGGGQRCADSRKSGRLAYL